MAESAVLVLNNVYQAVQITGMRRAFRLFYAGRARAGSARFPDLRLRQLVRTCRQAPTTRRS
jgi:hypothetical protein